MMTKNRVLIFRFICILLLNSMSNLCISQELSTVNEVKLKYFGKAFFLLEGTEIADSLKENRYDRLPIAYKQIVRKPVWDLSKSSTGMSIKFRTNSTKIKVKWTVLNDNKMNHMAETGIKGLDLYYNNNKNWQYIGTGIPSGKENEYLLIDNMLSEMREFKIYLPLYDGIEQIEVGIDSNSVIEKPEKGNRKSIIFYGTSITQGGCASRPGMVHTNIISRKLNVDCLNFGFSGNGRMEQAIVELIAGFDPYFYVIECLPNMNPEQIINRTQVLTKIIRKNHPVTPIVFVENFLYEQSVLDLEMHARIEKNNIALRTEYDKMIEKGFQNILYIESTNAIGMDHEGTVDGTHFTDLGFMRYADFLIAKFDQLGLKYKTLEE